MLDIDVKDDRANGWDSLEDLGHSILPDSPVAHTSSGGVHWYFAHPERPLKCSTGLLGPGLDVRSDGGYVILPSPGSGYEWDPIANFDTVSLAPAPDWLWPPKTSRDILPKAPLRPVQGLSPYGTATIEAACRAIVSAPVGEQERVLNAESFSVGTAAGAGLVPADIALRALLRAAALMPDHDPSRPWRPEEIDLKVRRAFAAGQAIHGRRAVPWLDDDPEVKAARELYRHSANNKRNQRPPMDGQVKLKRGRGYQMQKISWLWPGWFARGKLHVLGGQKGTGKSTIGFEPHGATYLRRQWDGTPAPLGDTLICPAKTTSRTRSCRASWRPAVIASSTLTLGRISPSTSTRATPTDVPPQSAAPGGPHRRGSPRQRPCRGARRNAARTRPPPSEAHVAQRQIAHHVAGRRLEAQMRIAGGDAVQLAVPGAGLVATCWSAATGRWPYVSWASSRICTAPARVVLLAARIASRARGRSARRVERAIGHRPAGAAQRGLLAALGVLLGRPPVDVEAVARVNAAHVDALDGACGGALEAGLALERAEFVVEQQQAAAMPRRDRAGPPRGTGWSPWAGRPG